MKTSVPVGELLSSLADGQLDKLEIASVLEACKNDETALVRWETYHLIGDALRSPAHVAASATVGARSAFVGRLNRRLEQEKAIGAPPALVEVLPVPLANPVTYLNQRREAASNDGTFRWKLAAGVASLLAVSAIAWNASGLLSRAAPPQLAQASSARIVVASPQGMMVRDARLEELLAAHKQFGAGSALQESSVFLRNAAFDTQQNALAASGR